MNTRFKVAGVLIWTGLAVFSVAAHADGAAVGAGSSGGKACEIVTGAVLKKFLGIEADTGQEKQSNLNGSTCVFKGKNKGINGLMNVTVQITSKNGKMYYQPDLYKTAKTQRIKEGQYDALLSPPPPGAGSANFSVLKGDVFGMVTVMSTAKFSQAQFKAFFDYFVSKL